MREGSDSFFGHDMEVEERDRRVIELNVLAQVYWIMQQPTVAKSVRERGMKVHGFVYNSDERSCVKLEITSPEIFRNSIATER